MLLYIILVVISAKLHTLLCNSTWVAHVEVSNPTAKLYYRLSQLFMSLRFMCVLQIAVHHVRK